MADSLLIILNLLGGLGIFLLGVRVINDGILRFAGDRFRRILHFITGNRFVGLLTGALVTAVIQSSSATTVMVVSFVNAGLLNLTQSISVIMGANIGTTVTGWIVALFGFKFDLVTYTLPAIGVGLLFSFSRKAHLKDLGQILTGFGLLFLGLSFLKDSVPDFQADSLSFLREISNYGILSTFLFICIGTLLTILVHSSSASTAMIITVGFNGFVDFPSCAAMVLGSNIGTTIDSVLAGIESNVHARQAALFHVLFNVIGTFIVFCFFHWFLDFIDFILPEGSIPSKLAAFHTVFNLFTSAVFIGFVPQIAQIIEKIMPADPKERPGQPLDLDSLPPSAGLSESWLIMASSKMGKLFRLIKRMVLLYASSFEDEGSNKPPNLSEMVRLEGKVAELHQDISMYLMGCVRDLTIESSREKAVHLMKVENELKSIGDDCVVLEKLADKRIRKDLPLHPNVKNELGPYVGLVVQALALMENNLDGFSKDTVTKVYDLEEQIDELRKLLQKTARNNIEAGGDLRGELLFMDLVRVIERMGDHCLNIAKSLRLIEKESARTT